MPDDVPAEEKERRRKALDDLQAQVVAEINARWLGKTVPVLFEEQHKGKWRGRTPQNKLVFVDSSENLFGRVADVEITWTGPWSMQGRLPGRQSDPAPEVIEILPIASSR
jgi:tRNA-2-methylthio-N6-dimethylallyladenosine synthase